MQWWESFKEWFLSLGETYGVSPYIFGGIYIGAIPLFFLCLRWTIQNIGKRKPFVVPLLLTGLCIVSAYIYLIIAGKNIPAWVYFFIGAMILYGAYSTYSKIKNSKKTAA